MDKKSFGKQLKKLRESHGMTTSGLSAAIGVKETEFSLWENGEKLPSLEQAAMIANAFGVTLDVLTEYQPTYKMKEIDDFSEDEKKILSEAIKVKSAKDYKKGKFIVAVIVAIELILTVLSCILTLDLGSIVFSLVFFVLLYKGKPWARYLYIFISIQTVISVFMVMDITAPAAVIIAELIIIALRLFGAIFFAFSRSVKEFLYGQYAG